MSNKPRKMNSIRLVLQSLSKGINIKQIAQLHRISKNTVKRYRSIITKGNYMIEDLIILEDYVLEDIFYKGKKISLAKEEILSKEKYYREQLNRPHVTLQLLYEEYKESGGKLSRSRFYDVISENNKKNNVTYTQRVIAGRRIEVDYAGSKLEYIDENGEIRLSEVLVCVLPYSNLVYCEAQESQRQENYINGLGRMLKYVGCVPQEIVSDNLRSGIKRSSTYEPQLTDLCEEASLYYNVHITATRVRKPRDKASVERTVRIVYQRIYAKIRDRQIKGLEELNEIIRRELEELNNRRANERELSRREKFEQEEKPYMSELKVTDLMSIKRARICKVSKNYHVELTEDNHYYSVPYEYTEEEVKMIYGETTVEFLSRGKRIAIYQRKRQAGGYSSEIDHMPPHHQAAHQVNGYTKTDIVGFAAQIGENTKRVVEDIIERNKIESQAFKSALGVIHLSKKYGKERLEKANERLLFLKPTYTSVRNYLEKRMDELKQNEKEDVIIIHDNMRHINKLNDINNE